jgi:hypothetical protein
MVRVRAGRNAPAVPPYAESGSCSRQGAKLAKEFQGVVEVIWLTHRAIRMLRKSLCFFLASWREQLPDLGLP